jgi:hypothetical protein
MLNGPLHQLDTLLAPDDEEKANAAPALRATGPRVDIRDFKCGLNRRGN